MPCRRCWLRLDAGDMRGEAFIAYAADVCAMFYRYDITPIQRVRVYMLPPLLHSRRRRYAATLMLMPRYVVFARAMRDKSSRRASRCQPSRRLMIFADTTSSRHYVYADIRSILLMLLCCCCHASAFDMLELLLCGASGALCRC